MFIPHLSTISRHSWHYRLVSKWHKLFGDPMPKSPFKYWCYELPLTIVAAVVISVVVTAFGGVVLVMIGVGVWEAFHHPLAALVDIGYVLAAIVASGAYLIICLTVEKWLKRHVPPLTVTG